MQRFELYNKLFFLRQTPHQNHKTHKMRLFSNTFKNYMVSFM
jgi:hypothetical protein